MSGMGKAAWIKPWSLGVLSVTVPPGCGWGSASPPCSCEIFFQWTKTLLHFKISLNAECVCVWSDHPLFCKDGESGVERKADFTFTLSSFINNGFMRFSFYFSFFSFCRYHKSQAIYLESKENTKISCVISSVGANEVLGCFYLSGEGGKTWV